MPNPTTYASARQYVGFAVEAVEGTPVTPAVTVPVDSFNPWDQPTWIDDKGLRGSLVEPYGRVQGVLHSEFDMAGQAYFDTLPYLLSNIFGDVVYSGTYTGSGTTTLSVQANPGDLQVSTAASIASNTLIQIGTGTASEVRLTTGVSGAGPYVLTFVGGLKLTHATSVVVKPITAPYSQAFSVLNSGNGQPSSLTLTDYQGVTASAGMRAYPGCCVSDLTLKGTVDTSGITYTAKGLGWPSASAATFASAPSTVPLQPAWEANIGLNGTVGGAQIFTVLDYELSLKRVLERIHTASNTQNPYSIFRGALSASGKLTFVIADETPLSYLMQNTQPQLQIVVSNGLGGAAVLTLQVDMAKAAFLDSKINRGKAFVQYDTNFDGIATTTNAGWSGGFSPLSITMTNAVVPSTF